MKTNSALFLIAASVLAMAACSDDPTPERVPEAGKVIFQTIWPGEAPSRYSVVMNASEVEMTQATAEFPGELAPGDYPYTIFNKPSGFDFHGTFATVRQNSGSLVSPGLLYSNNGTVKVEEDGQHSVSAAMVPLVRPVNFTFRLADGSAADVKSLDAQMLGAASGVDLTTGTITGYETVQPPVAVSEGVFIGSHNILGVTGESQRLRAEVAVVSESFDIECDLTQAFAGFASNMAASLEIEITISNFGLSSIYMEVTGWEDGEIPMDNNEEPMLSEHQLRIDWPGMAGKIDVVELYDQHGNMFSSLVENDMTTGLYEIPEQIYRMNIYAKGDYREVSLNIYGYDRETGVISMSDEYYIWQARHFDLITDMNADYKIIADIDCEDYAITPVGYFNDVSDMQPFKGTLDGGGFKLTNLNFVRKNYTGLFAVNDGTIKDLTIESGNIGDNTVDYVAPICAINYGTIDNCINKATVRGRELAGGFAALNNGEILSCQNEGDVFSVFYAGGIAGVGQSGMTGCINRGKIEGQDYTGGIVGYMTADMTSCLNFGEVAGSNQYTGGIAGYCVDGVTINACVNNGAVSGGSQGGGIAGFTGKADIVRSHNTGTVSLQYSQAGGIVGYNGGTVKACTNAAAVSAGSYVGGIVGYSVGMTSALYCENQGPVTASDSGAGGIVANGINCLVESCINHRDAKVVAGGATVGGIMGTGGTNCRIFNCANYADVVSGGNVNAGIAGNFTGTMTACKNAGNVYCTEEYPTYTGGLIGYASSNITVTACCNVGSVDGFSNVAGGVGYFSSGTVTAFYTVGEITGTNDDRTGAMGGYVLPNAKFYACYWDNAPRESGRNENTNDGEKDYRRFSASAWPADDVSLGWGLVSGGNDYESGYYWASLGDYSSDAYPQLWWEDGNKIGVSAAPIE